MYNPAPNSAVAIYRDNSKRVQPLSSGSGKGEKKNAGAVATAAAAAAVAPGEIFITMAKEGSTISGLMDAFATAVSFNLQYGVPFKFLVDKFAHVRFEPSGWTGNPQIPYAKSIMDYIFRWMGAKFLGPEYAVSEAGESMTLRPTEASPQQELPFNIMTTDAPLCSECGSIMTRNGSCYKCGNCGGTSGCS